jgi:RNA polymerase sigma-70 factor, ECF subfamily
MKSAFRLPHPREIAQDPSSLIARAIAGDPLAERALYDAHVDRTYHLAFRMTGDEELAMESTQQAFIRAFAALHTFRGNSSFSTWLHRVTVNVVTNHLRQVRRFRQRELQLDAADTIAASSHQRDPILRQRIQDALRSLPEMYRTVVMMHDVDGFTHAQIGEVLEIPSATSKARLFRARAQLRRLLAGCALEYAS